MAIEDLRNRDWLLLPGTLCTEKVFSGCLDALGIPRTRRKVIVLRHSKVEDYAAEMNGPAEDAIVCGFSLGAIVAAHLSERLRARRIILFGVNPHPDDPNKAAGRYDLERDVLAQGGATAMSRRLPDLGGPSADRVRSMILTMADKAAGHVAAQTRLAMSRPGALASLSKTLCPVLSLTGGKDKTAPAEQGRAASDAAPKGTFRILHGLGHYALLEDPTACAKAILDWEHGDP